MSGWSVGSPPEICSTSATPSSSISRSTIPVYVSKLTCCPPGPDSAKHVGHFRLQFDVTSTSAMQVCCSCSVQTPQSYGHPLSGSTPYLRGTRAGWECCCWSQYATSEQTKSSISPCAGHRLRK